MLKSLKQHLAQLEYMEKRFGKVAEFHYPYEELLLSRGSNFVEELRMAIRLTRNLRERLREVSSSNSQKCDIGVDPGIASEIFNECIQEELKNNPGKEEAIFVASKFITITLWMESYIEESRKSGLH